MYDKGGLKLLIRFRQGSLAVVVGYPCISPYSRRKKIIEWNVHDDGGAYFIY
jgi:hypothetical protein